MSEEKREATTTAEAWALANIRTYWSFDNQQQHTHNWHSREDFIEEWRRRMRGESDSRASVLTLIEDASRHLMCEVFEDPMTQAFLKMLRDATCAPSLTTPEQIDAEIRRLQDRIDELHAMLIPKLPENAGGGEMATDVHGEQR